MSKKNKVPERKEVERTADYYKLKTKAVKELVEADESNSPPVSDKELRKYKSGLGIKIPDLVKICFIKWWFPAAVCFFFLWGLGNYLADMLDMLFVTGIGLGVVTDLLTNNTLRFIEPYPGAWKKWIILYKKSYSTFPLNILYAFVILLLIFASYGVINYVAMLVLHQSTMAAYVGVEPILFGLFYLVYDMLIVLMRNTLRNIVSDAKKSGR